MGEAIEPKYPAARAFLWRYRDAQREMDYLQEHIAFLREQATGLQRQLDGMPRGSPSRDRMAGIVSGLVDEETAVLDKLAQVHDVRREVMRVIDLVPVEKQRRVLFMAYIQGLTADEIADRIDMSKSSAKLAQAKAMAYIEEHCADVLRAAGCTPGSGGSPVEEC